MVSSIRPLASLTPRSVGKQGPIQNVGIDAPLLDGKSRTTRRALLAPFPHRTYVSLELRVVLLSPSIQGL